MRIQTFSDIKLPVEEGEEKLFSIAEKKFGRKPAHLRICKKSLDARDKNAMRYVYTIEVADQIPPKQEKNLERLRKEKLPTLPVLVVGSGPAGLFCALRLLDRGITPIVIERGAPVEEREKDIQTFLEDKKLNCNSNVQFGEGGAGTFSDGKLNTQTHSVFQREVLETFVKFGAPKEILWLQKPHIGSDNLKKVVKNMRDHIRQRGGQVRFHTTLWDIETKEGKLISAILKTPDGEEKTPVSALVLAIGHSARDTFTMLYRRGVPMRQKDFAVGVRIEHLQSKIGVAQYGKSYEKLPPADYKLVSHASDRAVFTFCMCPGGVVMPATSEEGCVVTNGMSNYARDERNANSALIAQVSRADFSSDSPLAGIEFQRKLERQAFLVGGGNYSAPVQLVGDFLADKGSSKFGEILPSYGAGTSLTDLRAVLPTQIIQALKQGLLDMDRRLKGFADPSAILTATETRTSSPLRIERGEDGQSLGVRALYPCGEGAGYAGGITSSAVDGIKIADAIFHEFSR